MTDAFRLPNRPQQQKKRSNPIVFWAWVIVPLLVVVAWKLAILVLLGLLPGFVALIIDRRPEKYAAYCVSGFNLCGVVPWVMKFFMESRSSIALQDILSNPFAWLTMYGAGALGWLVFSWTPELVLRVTNFRGWQEVTSLKKRQDTLIEEWGTTIIPPKIEHF